MSIPSQAARDEKASRFGIAARYAAAEQLLDLERLDIVDICAPRELHVDLVKLCASQGLDVICQKPLAPDFAQAAELVAWLPDGPKLMVHENWRFRAYYRRMKEWLRAGVAGEIRHVQLDFLSSGMVADCYRRSAGSGAAALL